MRRISQCPHLPYSTVESIQYIHCKHNIQGEWKPSLYVLWIYFARDLVSLDNIEHI